MTITRPSEQQKDREVMEPSEVRLLTIEGPHLGASRPFVRGAIELRRRHFIGP